MGVICIKAWLHFAAMGGFQIWFLSIVALCVQASTQQSKPNIVFILTDDQDRTANSLDYMPYLNKILRQGGTEFTHYYVSTALCCPSRATILRGQYCHNTKIWDNGDLNNSTFLSGGFKKWMNLSLESSTIATLFKAGGYETKLCGKYLNGYDDPSASHVPEGWDHWHGLTKVAYFGPHFSDNGKLLITPKTTYQTDYIRDQALEFINKQRDKNKPFFLYLSPFAPHAPSRPAPRHAHLFNDTKAPRYPSYNPDDSVQSQKPSWIKILPKLTQTQVDSIDDFYRNRLRALQAVDEMLLNITSALDAEGILDNTYIFYTSDNGQHLGDYRLPAGKRQAYDTDVNVPFLVRGPGIKGGIKNSQLIQSVDLLPTWMELAGIKGPSDAKQQDGKSMMNLLHDKNVEGEFRNAAILEMLGGSSNMPAIYSKYPLFEKNRFWNNTYVAIRVTNNIPQIYDKTNFMFALWCTGETELYNLTTDPHEIKNLADELTTREMMGLQELVVNLSTCAGSECHDINSIVNDIVVDLEYRLKTGQSSSAQIPCHNPPDLPGSDHDVQTYIDNSEYCYDNIEDCGKSLLKFGLPFADDDKIPEHVSDALEVYEQIQNAS